MTADPERVKQILKRFGFTYARMSKGDCLIFHSNVRACSLDKLIPLLYFSVPVKFGACYIIGQ